MAELNERPAHIVTMRPADCEPGGVLHDMVSTLTATERVQLYEEAVAGERTDVRFVSVRRPALGDLDLDDIYVCENPGCDGTGVISRRVYGNGDAYLDGEEDCRAEDGGCDGYGLVHGWCSDGSGMPVDVVVRAHSLGEAQS